MSYQEFSDSPRSAAKDQIKRERFVRIAEQRTQKVLDDLMSLSKCAAKESYEYTSADVEQILAAIEQGLQRVRNSFAGLNRFSLSDNQESKGTLDDVVRDAQQRAYKTQISDVQGFLSAGDKLPEAR